MAIYIKSHRILIREEYTLKPIKSLKKPHMSRSPSTLFSFTRILCLFLVAVHWVMGFCFVRETVRLADILMSDPKHIHTCVKRSFSLSRLRLFYFLKIRNFPVSFVDCHYTLFSRRYYYYRFHFKFIKNVHLICENH